MIVLGRFLHGLMFFTLSLTIFFLQSRSQRVLLARRVHWLGGVAICEAIVAWNNLFAGLTPPVALLPAFFGPLILGIGYSLLLALGIQAFLPEETAQTHGQRWLAGLIGAWVILDVSAFLIFPAQRATVTQIAEILAHGLLGFPGGLLAAIGLRRQSRQMLKATLRKRVRPYLQLVEITTGIFGVLQVLYLPIQVSGMLPGLVEWLWALMGAGLTYSILRALNTVQLEIERWIEGVERLQALAADRERIGRDLHDGIIQSIYAAGLLLESVQPIIPLDPLRAQAQLGRVMDNLNETIQDIRRYIFDLRSDMPDEDLPSGIKRLLRDFHINTLLETEFEITGAPVEILSAERRRHIFQIVRETLANTARHARARWVKIHLHYDEHALDLTISDDGIGMETLQISKGYGLRNIRERVRLLDGTLRIESAPNEGVTFHLTVPY